MQNVKTAQIFFEMLVSVYMCMHSVYIGLMITSCTILLVQGKGPPPATPTGLGPSSTDNLTASSGFSSNVGGASVGGGTPQGGQCCLDIQEL